MSDFLAAAQADAESWSAGNLTAISAEEIDLWYSSNYQDPYFKAYFNTNPHSYYIRSVGYHMRDTDPIPLGVLQNCRMGMPIVPTDPISGKLLEPDLFTSL